MKQQLFVLSFLILCAFVATKQAGKDYQWGEASPTDFKLAKETVKKAFFVGAVQTKKFTFKQKNNLDALTITAIKVTDKMGKNGAVVQLISGGPGSKGATLQFTSARGHGIKDLVEIWGR